jgi:hypothetical protein
VAGTGVWSWLEDGVDRYQGGEYDEFGSLCSKTLDWVQELLNQIVEVGLGLYGCQALKWKEGSEEV